MTVRNLLPALLALVPLCAAEPSLRAQSPALEERRLVGTVAAGGRLEVRNPAGDVRLRAGSEQGREVEVFAVLQPSEAGRLPEVRLLEPGGGLLLVQVEPPEAGAGRAARADLVLFVPAETPTRVVTGDGRIEAKGLRGSLQATTARGEIAVKGVKGGVCAQSASGAISAELTDAPAGQSLTTETGEIAAYLWEDADLTVRAATSGEISTDFTLQVEYRRSEEPNKLATAVLGKGTAGLRLDSKQGRVRILRLPRGFKKEGPDAPKPEPSDGP